MPGIAHSNTHREVDEAIAELRKNGAEANLETQLHFLKGSALNLGLADFSTRCQTGETAAANGHSDEIDLPDIIQCYEASKVEFLAALDEQSAA